MDTVLIKLVVAVVPPIVLIVSVALLPAGRRRCRRSQPARPFCRRPAAVGSARSRARLVLPLMLLLCGGLLSGCAVFQRENRLTMNALDRAVQGTPVTGSTTAKVLAAPLALSVGATAGIVDLALVTPARATVPAARDTSSYLWENPAGSELRQMMLLLPKTVATPVVFLSDWGFRSVFTTRF